MYCLCESCELRTGRCRWGRCAPVGEQLLARCGASCARWVTAFTGITAITGVRGVAVRVWSACDDDAFCVGSAERPQRPSVRAASTPPLRLPPRSIIEALLVPAQGPPFNCNSLRSLYAQAHPPIALLFSHMLSYSNSGPICCRRAHFFRSLRYPFVDRYWFLIPHHNFVFIDLLTPSVSSCYFFISSWIYSPNSTPLISLSLWVLLFTCLFV